MPDRESKWDRGVWWIKLPDGGRWRTALPHEAAECEHKAVVSVLEALCLLNGYDPSNDDEIEWRAAEAANEQIRAAIGIIERGEHRHG